MWYGESKRKPRILALRGYLRRVHSTNEHQQTRKFTAGATGWLGCPRRNPTTSVVGGTQVVVVERHSAFVVDDMRTGERWF
jgi:hypothetical protein